jgi:hypothetical protein
MLRNDHTRPTTTLHRPRTARVLLALAVGLALAGVGLAAASGPAAADGTRAANTTVVNGTVTVDGSPAAANVTVTPLTAGMRRAGDPVTARATDGRFAVRAPAASQYAVRVRHGDLAHYALTSGPAVRIELGATLGGRVLAPNGSALSGAQVQVLSGLGPTVGVVETDAEGRFSVGPLRPDRRYRLRVRHEGVPYTRTVRTGNGSVELRLREPTDDRGVLRAAGGQPAGHVVQIRAPRNGSRVTVVETLTLENTADRPFLGRVTVAVPRDAAVLGARYRGREINYRHNGSRVEVGALVTPTETTRISVAYRIEGRTFEKPLATRTGSLAVALDGYAVRNVSHSANLAPGDAPVELLVNDGPVGPGDTVRVDLDGGNGTSGGTDAAGAGTTGRTSAAGSDGSDGEDGTPTPEDPPIALLSAGFLVVVVGGLVAYRTL